jgi:hypothetical protein
MTLSGIWHIPRDKMGHNIQHEIKRNMTYKMRLSGTSHMLCDKMGHNIQNKTYRKITEYAMRQNVTLHGTLD